MDMAYLWHMPVLYNSSAKFVACLDGYGIFMAYATLSAIWMWHICGICLMYATQVLQERFVDSPRSDVCQRFRQGIWNVQKVCLP